MPSWKKVITSGSSAELNSLKLTGAVNAGTDTDKFLVLDAAGNIDYRTGTQVLSDIGANSATVIPQIIVTAAEVVEEGSTSVYISLGQELTSFQKVIQRHIHDSMHHTMGT